MIRAENTWSEFREPEGDKPVYDDKKRRPASSDGDDEVSIQYI
jgi:hypothetical protein